MSRFLQILRILKRRITRHSGSDRALFFEALCYLILYRIYVRLVPFRYWADRLGLLAGETDESDDPALTGPAQKIRWAIHAAGRYVPGESTCLMRAAAAKRMLDRRSIPGTVYLGVISDTGNERLIQKAHAWLRCGDVIVTGEEEYRQYKTVTTFGSVRP